MRLAELADAIEALGEHGYEVRVRRGRTVETDVFDVYTSCVAEGHPVHVGTLVLTTPPSEPPVELVPAYSAPSGIVDKAIEVLSDHVPAEHASSDASNIDRHLDPREVG